jgi:hypothetical protein
MRKLRWEIHEPTTPKHPYRDSAIIYGGLAAIVVVIAAVTGGSVVKGVIAGAAFFAAAMGYSWWRWRDRLRKREGGEQ